MWRSLLSWTDYCTYASCWPSRQSWAEQERKTVTHFTCNKCRLDWSSDDINYWLRLIVVNCLVASLLRLSRLLLLLLWPRTGQEITSNLFSQRAADRWWSPSSSWRRQLDVGFHICDCDRTELRAVECQPAFSFRAFRVVQKGNVYHRNWVTRWMGARCDVLLLMELEMRMVVVVKLSFGANKAWYCCLGWLWKGGSFLLPTEVMSLIKCIGNFPSISAAAAQLHMSRSLRALILNKISGGNGKLQWLAINFPFYDLSRNNLIIGPFIPGELFI